MSADQIREPETTWLDLAAQVHGGAANPQAIELWMRTLLQVGLEHVRRNDYLRAEIVDVVMQALPDKPDRWARLQEELSRTLAQRLDPSHPDGVVVAMGYPSSAGRFPHIAVTLENTSEDGAGNTAGDLLDHLYVEMSGEPGTARSILVVGSTEQSRVQITVWALEVELAAMLEAAVRTVLRNMSGPTLYRGIHDMNLSSTGFTPEEPYSPRISYVPMITASITWDRRSTILRDRIVSGYTAAGRFT